MGILNLFSKRQKVLRGEVADVYQYDDVPHQLRVQLVHVFRDAFGKADKYGSQTAGIYKSLHNGLAREYGQFHLSEEAKWAYPDFELALFNFFLKTDDTEKALDIIEICCQMIDTYCRKYEFTRASNPKISPNEAIEETNERLRYAGIGYKYEDGELFRIDSELIHSEVVKPVLKLLSDPIYQGADEEFRKAHEHYRHNRYKESLNEALKSFESVMKAICDKHGWKYGKGDAAKKLIAVCFDNGLIPPFMQTHISTLRSNLESGVPTTRNKLGSHGQGTTSVSVPQHIAAYQLHNTASVLLLLIDSEKTI
jgi:hypothetical protein